MSYMQKLGSNKIGTVKRAEQSCKSVNTKTTEVLSCEEAKVMKEAMD